MEYPRILEDSEIKLGYDKKINLYYVYARGEKYIIYEHVNRNAGRRPIPGRHYDKEYIRPDSILAKKTNWKKRVNIAIEKLNNKIYELGLYREGKIFFK